MLSNGNLREKVVASIEHGTRGEELRLSLIKNRGGQAERLELRNWLKRDDLAGQRGPTSHGLQIPLEIVPWLVEKLRDLSAFEEKMMAGERPE